MGGLIYKLKKLLLFIATVLAIALVIWIYDHILWIFLLITFAIIVIIFILLLVYWEYSHIAWKIVSIVCIFSIALADGVLVRDYEYFQKEFQKGLITGVVKAYEIYTTYKDPVGYIKEEMATQYIKNIQNMPRIHVEPNVTVQSGVLNLNPTMVVK